MTDKEKQIQAFFEASPLLSRMGPYQELTEERKEMVRELYERIQDG